MGCFCKHGLRYKSNKIYTPAINLTLVGNYLCLLTTFFLVKRENPSRQLLPRGEEAGSLKLLLTKPEPPYYVIHVLVLVHGIVLQFFTRTT